MTADPTGAGFRLLPIRRDGAPEGAIDPLSETLVEACRATAGMYDRLGFDPPWIGYVAVASGRAVGGGAFVGAPREGRVEIAYFTAPEFEGRGHAALTARALVALAREADPTLKIYAKTAPELNASTTILSRLGFRRIGTTIDDEIGEAWAWLLG